jgi:alginate O-acetyltransferase complex protein AlgI
MAIGLGKMIGFRFKENFDRPYISASLTEFWTRWHISLSSWMRDYLYIPLGGNRRGTRRAVINVVIVFLLSGLWHGAAWTFVAWGAFHGAFVALERIVGRRREQLPRVAQHAITLVLVLVAWVLFRSTSIGQATDIIAAMFGAVGSQPPHIIMSDLIPRFSIVALIFGIAVSLAPIVSKYRTFEWPRLGGLTSVAYLALFVLSSIHLTNLRFTPLIYFKF